MKIKISFSPEEREDALRLADTIRRMFPHISRQKEAKKPGDKFGHIYLQDNRP